MGVAKQNAIASSAAGVPFSDSGASAKQERMFAAGFTRGPAVGPPTDQSNAKLQPGQGEDTDRKENRPTYGFGLGGFFGQDNPPKIPTGEELNKGSGSNSNEAVPYGFGFY